MSFVSSLIGRCYDSDIMLLPCFFIVISGDTLYHGVKVTSVRIMCVVLVNVSMNCWCLLEPSSAFMVIVWDNLVWGNTDFEECFIALHMISVCFPLENCLEWHIDDSIYWFSYVIFVESVSTSESMIPRPCFKALHTVSFQFCYMFAHSDTYFRLHLLLERDSFDLLLPEFDKPWVIHLRETCCCSTNLCTWRPKHLEAQHCLQEQMHA
jgi:hypothetical protein